MSADPNQQADISERHFPGEEEPTTQAAWIALATVLVFLAAILVYMLHIAAPDPHQEYTKYMKSRTIESAEGHLAAARYCDALGPKLDSNRDAHLRTAFEQDAALPGLEDELMKRYGERAEGALSAQAHVSLAEWCVGFNLKQAALQEYRAALATDADNAAAQKGLQDLQK